MNKLRLASFGMRGFIGESLPPELVIDFASAFARSLAGGRVLLGRDTRDSSTMIHAAVTAGLLSAGCEVLDCGICPTPMLQYAVKRYDAAGALSVSGGHTAMGWNAVTLIGPDGAFLEPVSGEAVLDSFHARDFIKRNWQQMGAVVPITDLATAYFADMLARVQLDAIRAAEFTVLIDPVGGAGCPHLTPFAEQLNVRLIPINGQPSGYLAREPEPRPRSARQMASIIPFTGGDAGFVLSSDMGRMSIVTETGEPSSEEYTFPLIANHVLARQSGPIVTNVCTTRTLDDVARMHHAPLLKTRVGQAYVVSRLRDEQAVLGGEGSGSMVYPAFSHAFDGFMMMALILEAMAVGNCTLSTLLRALPRYAIVKRSVSCNSRDGYRAMETLKDADDFATEARIDVTDGLRMDWEDAWLHVRTSQTQQLVRVIAEADTAARAEQRAEEAVRIIQQAL
jgi:phosphomannomutase